MALFLTASRSPQGGLADIGVCKGYFGGIWGYTPLLKSRSGAASKSDLLLGGSTLREGSQNPFLALKWSDYGLLKTAKTEKCSFSWRIVSPTPGSNFCQFGW